MTMRTVPGFKRLTGNSSLAYSMIVVTIFGIGTIGSIINWHTTIDRTRNNLIAHYNQELNQSKSILTQNLAQYSQLLDDGTSLLAVEGPDITQDAWLTFFQSYGLTNNYPGIDGVNYSSYVPASTVSDFLTTITAQGQPTFSINPSGARDAYVPITYMGYITPSSSQALGYDQLADPARADAITKAIQSGKITMSGKITPTVHKGHTVFLILKPIYNGPANTVAEREASIKGFVYVAINSDAFFRPIFAHYIGSSNVALQIYDSQAPNHKLLHQTDDFQATTQKMKHPIRSKVAVNFGDRTWDVRVVADQSILQVDSSQATSNLILGVILSAIAAGLLWYFTYYRERRIYWQKQNELQLAKDELLSLASHQLRTPATIVKQYLGLLLQNYAGEITSQQRTIVQTAYDSNERQLEIANQFLEAARLGSGRIELHTTKTNLIDVLNGVIAEQRKIARQRRQKIAFESPKRAYYVDGDPKYLPMVFENLLSNASKYSNRSTTITVGIRRDHDTVQVTVTDTGIGIAAEELPTLFEKFSHASNEHSASGNSTGIGLYLAQQIAELHGGTISVKSTLGEGSEFTVRLPLRVKQEN